MKSDEDILDILTSGCRDQLQMVLLVDPEEKVVIVVDVDSSSRLKVTTSRGLTVSSQRKDFSLEKFLQQSCGEILQAVILS